jgi:hypothetical protein
MNDEVIALLRSIRDQAWQYGRCHEQFFGIEQMAIAALEKLGVDDGALPNPRRGKEEVNRFGF